MIIDLNRSIDLSWLLMSDAIFILRWSCFMYLNYHIQQAGIIKCLQTFIYIYKQIFLANHSWSRKNNISSSVGKGRRRSLLPKVNWELRNFDCSYKSPFQLASILLPPFPSSLSILICLILFSFSCHVPYCPYLSQIGCCIKEARDL